MAELEQGILVERQCAQLVEQHEAAQDWLREQVKSLPVPPEETEALHGAINTLKVSKRSIAAKQVHICGSKPLHQPPSADIRCQSFCWF